MKAGASNEGYQTKGGVSNEGYHTKGGISNEGYQTTFSQARSAPHRSPNVEILLGALYRAGDGVEEDLPEAARLFALAADKVPCL